MFSWSTKPARPSSNSYPANRTTGVAQAVQGSIRPPEYTRMQHLDSYLKDDTLKKSTRRVSADDSTYDTVFQTTTGDALILRVNVPLTPHASAPCRAPAMTLVAVRASHPWLDSRMRVVGYKATQSDEEWKASRTLLGTAVHDVIRHLQLNPPQILEITDQSLQKLQRRLGASGGSSTQSHRGFPSHPPQHNTAGLSVSTDAPPNYESLLSTPEVDMPAIPRVFPEINSLSTAELQEMLDDEVDFLAFCYKSVVVHQQIQKMRNSVIGDNAKVADKNLNKEEKIKSLHEKATTMQKELKEKLKIYQELENKQNEIIAPPDTRLIIKELTKAKRSAMKESDEYAEEFIDDGGDVDAFIKKFLEKRKVHHVRAAKIERLEAMSRQSEF